MLLPHATLGLYTLIQESLNVFAQFAPPDHCEWPPDRCFEVQMRLLSVSMHGCHLVHAGVRHRSAPIQRLRPCVCDHSRSDGRGDL